MTGEVEDRDGVAAPTPTDPPWFRRWALELVHLRSRWGRSLQLRVLTVTGTIGVVALVLVSIFLSARVQEALYDQRVQEALGDAQTRTAQIQAQFDASTATTQAQVQAVAFQIINAAQSPRSGAAATLIRPTPSEAASAVGINFNVGRQIELIELSSDIRAAVQESGTQQWQAVEVTTTDGIGPGIVVGSVVHPPVLGQHELYFVYSLIPEQNTLTLIQRTLTVAGLVLLGLLAAMAWFLTRQVLGPVQAAARTAEEISTGHLEVRMPVRGQDELALLSRSFNEMAESLQDQIERLANLSRLQQQFVSDVSHELRTPLTTIRMATEMLNDARGEFDPATRRSAELLHTQVDRFEVLLADLLEISRFDAGAAALDAEHVDLRTVVRRAVELAAPLAERMGTSLVLAAPDVECGADLDPRRVDRILRNLLANAIEHADGRPIDVVVAADPSAVAVSVIDHGIGMTQRQVEQVFDRFWRGDPSRARTLGGTGLGLAISLEDARLHHGRLEAWARPGVGATFRLTLPRRAGVLVDSSPGPLAREHAQVEPKPVITGVSPAALPGMQHEGTDR